MGGGKGGGGTSTQYSGVQIPQEVLQRYNKATDRAENVSQTPWSNYGGEFVAPVNATQQSGYGTMMAGQSYTDAGWQMPNQALLTGVEQASPLFQQASGSINTGQAQGQVLGAAGLGQAAQAYNQAQPYNQQAGQAYSGAYGGAQGYNAAATDAAVAGMGAIDPSQLNLGQFYNPYQQQVTEATMAQLGQQQAQQRNDQRGQMIREGSFGGDRSGVANANMVNQQNLASAQVLGQLNTANYGQALGAAQQQQGVGLGAAQANRQAVQQGAGQLLGIGQQGYQQGMGLGQAQQGLGQQQYTQGMGQAQYTGQMGQQMYGQGVGAGQAQAGLGQAQYGMYGDVAAKQAALAGQAFGQNMQTAQGQMGFGTMQQQTQQAQDSAQYNQWLQEQGYPYQASQFYTNAVMGTGPLSGSSSYSGAFTPQPFFSDERVKENMQQIGRTHDGQAIYRFNYKGHPGTQIGLSAQEVEHKHPEAVSEHGGIKAVEYSAATDDAARAHRALGGALMPGGGTLGVAPTLPTVGPTGLGDIVTRQRLMFGANAPGSGRGAPLGLPSPAGTTAPPTPPAGAGPPPMPADKAAPVAEALMAPGGPRAVPVAIDPGGSANGATGDSSGSPGGEAGSVGAGVGTAAGDAGAAAAGGNSGGSAAAGVGGDDGGTYASGGRAGYAKGSKVDRADGYAGGFGDLDSIMAAQAAMYGAAPWAAKPAGTGSIVPQLQAAKASPLIKPDLPKAPAAAQKTGAQEGLGAANDAVKTAKSLEEAYGMGKDALVGSPQKGTAAIPGVGKPGDANYVKAVPASADYKPATGGIVGYGGKWSGERPPETPTTPTTPTAAPAPAPSPAAAAPPTNASPNPSATTLPAAPAAPVTTAAADTTADLGDAKKLADAGDLADTSLADLGLDAGSLAGLGDAGALAETGSAVADAAPYLEDAAMFARKGGRVGYSKSGVVEDTDAQPYGGTSILPESLYNADTPNTDPLKPPAKKDDAGGGGGGGGTDAGDVAAMAAPLAGAAIGSVIPGVGTMIGGLAGGLIGGGIKAARGKHAAGGEVNDNEPPEPGLAPAAEAIAPPDNVHYGVFSRSQGHKMVGRATTRRGATRILDRKDNEYGAYDHFVKPIPPSRKRAYGGRLAFADAGEVTAEDDEAERELVARKLREREAEALGAARTEPDAVEPTPAAREILKGVETARAQPAPGLAAAEQQVAGPGMPAPPAAAPAADPNVVQAQAAPPPPPPAVEAPQQAVPGLGGGIEASLPTYPVAEGTKTLFGDKPMVMQGGTWRPDTPAEPPKPPPPPLKPGQQRQQPAADPDKPFDDPINIRDRHFTQESGQRQFDANGKVITSSAGAVGWGQLASGGPAAAALAGETWDPERAKTDEAYNKKLSNALYSHLEQVFPDDPYKAAAAYNCGEQCVKDATAKAAKLGGSWADYVPDETKNHLWVVSGQRVGAPGKGGGGGGVGNASTKAPGAPADAADVVPSDSGLGGASPEAKDLWGQSGDWWKRNESWGVPLLTGIGAMLSSPSRTLLGSIGTGMVAGGTQYGTLGQRQQGIDIQKQQAQTSRASSINEQIKQVQARLAANPNDPALKAYLQRLYGAWNQAMGGKTQVPDLYKTGAPGTFGDPNFEKLVDSENPAYWHRRYQITADPQDLVRANQAIDALRKNGRGAGKRPGETIDFDYLRNAAAQSQAATQTTVDEAGIKMKLGTPGTPEATNNANARVKFIDDAINGMPAVGQQTPKEKEYIESLRKERALIISTFLTTGRASGGRVWRAAGGRNAYALDGAVVADDEERPPDIQLAQADVPKTADRFGKPQLSDPGRLAPPPTDAPAPGPTMREDEIHNSEDAARFIRENGRFLKPADAQRINQLQLQLQQNEAATQSRNEADPDNPGKTVQKPLPGAAAVAAEKKRMEGITTSNNAIMDKVHQEYQQGQQADQLAQTLLATLFTQDIDPATGKPAVNADGTPKLTPTTKMGKYAEGAGSIIAGLQYLGVDPDTIKQVTGVDLSKVEESKKLAFALQGVAAANASPGTAGLQGTFTQAQEGTPNVNLTPQTVQAMVELIRKRAAIQMRMPEAIKDKPFTTDFRTHLQEWQSNPNNQWRTPVAATPKKEGAAPTLEGIPPPGEREKDKAYTYGGVTRVWTGTGWREP